MCFFFLLLFTQFCRYLKCERCFRFDTLELILDMFGVLSSIVWLHRRFTFMRRDNTVTLSSRQFRWQVNGCMMQLIRSSKFFMLLFNQKTDLLFNLLKLYNDRDELFWVICIMQGIDCCIIVVVLISKILNGIREDVELNYVYVEIKQEQR